MPTTAVFAYRGSFDIPYGRRSQPSIRGVRRSAAGRIVGTVDAENRGSLFPDRSSGKRARGRKFRDARFSNATTTILSENAGTLASLPISDNRGRFQRQGGSSIQSETVSRTTALACYNKLNGPIGLRRIRWRRSIANISSIWILCR